jgi:hypothetical protein
MSDLIRMLLMAELTRRSNNPSVPEEQYVCHDFLTDLPTLSVLPDPRPFALKVRLPNPPLASQRPRDARICC